MIISFRNVDAHYNGDCSSLCPLCDIEDAQGFYACRSCDRGVNPHEETSPGEPNTCADCSAHEDKEAAP